MWYTERKQRGKSEISRVALRINKKMCANRRRACAGMNLHESNVISGRVGKNMADNTTESMKDYEKELERSFRTINEGDIVSGSVIAVSEEEVILDLNYYTQGIIKVENLSNDPDFNPKEQLQPGDVIEATVIKVDDGNGNIELSKKEANDVLAWETERKIWAEHIIMEEIVQVEYPTHQEEYYGLYLNIDDENE